MTAATITQSRGLSFSNRPILYIALALFTLALAARVLPGPRTIDDAFITFRYSRNIITGEGFVYNPGVHTLGTTTPLYTLLMALIGGVTGRQDFQWYALLVNALADAGTAVLLYLLARRLTGHDFWSAVPGALWAIAPASVTFAVGGMETSVTIFWMVVATWVYMDTQATGGNRRNILIGGLAGLGFLTRVDAVLWIGPLMLFQLADTWRSGSGLRRIPWKTWLAVIIVVLPWLLFSLSYFGSLFSNSLNAKSVAYTVPPASAFITLVQNYATLFSENTLLPGTAIAIGAVLYLTLSLIGILNTAHHLPRLLPFLIYPWLYMLVFAAANPLIFRWYTAPPLPALMVSIFAGAWALTASLSRWRGAVLALIALFWGLSSLSGWQIHPDHEPDRPAPSMAWHKIELYYQQIGTALRDEYGVTPETRVASADIGAIGYFSGATIIDTVGLVTPSLSRYYPNPRSLIVEGQNYAIPPQMILDTQPTYLVTMEAFVRLGLEQNAQFKAEYDLVRQTPTDFYGTGMYLYKRR
jgi:4-amino-4-deoxy-L-arabinose transferase-like glycosyltransferase